MLMYLTGTLHYQNTVEAARIEAKRFRRFITTQKYLIRQEDGGTWTIFWLAEKPVHPGQAEFKILPTDIIE